MYTSQSSLPNLPLPTLEQTCDLYLKILAPLLNQAEFETTQQLVTDFQYGIGPRLQNQLELIHKTTQTSYLYDLGVKNFLENRSPLPIHINFGCVLTPLGKSAGTSWTQAAAIWIHSILQVYRQVKAGTLEPDQESSKTERRPLCMIQYENLFGCGRIPGIKRDILHPRQDNQHVVVAWHDTFFSIDVMEGDRIASVETIAQLLNLIVERIDQTDFAIGALTTLNRTAWAIARNRLITLSSINQHSLQQLDSALFLVCLDDTEPKSLGTAARSALHGNGRNRWFDKPLQFIFTRDGWVGINVEHSGLDGYAVMRCLYEIQRISQQDTDSAPLPTIAPTPPQKLVWEFTDDLLEEIQLAESAIDQLIHNTDSRLLVFTEFGREYIKSYSLSPDAVVQLAIQLAYVRLHGEPVCTYESIHTRRFRYGRTEAMRSVTPESVELCTALSTTASDEQKLTALKAAVSAHVTRQRACQQGYGVDRHLAALQQVAQLQGLTPDLFSDRAYTQVLGQSVLSTSSLAPGMGIDAFCFGPVVEHGYGIGYIIEPTSIVINVTSQYRQTEQFVGLLENSLAELGKLMTVSYS